MEPILCFGKERDNLQSKGISKLIKAAQKQYASFLLALLSCKKDDSDFTLNLPKYRVLTNTLYQHQVKNVFTTAWGKKSKRWTHADNRSEGINALRNLNKLVLSVLDTLLVSDMDSHCPI